MKMKTPALPGHGYAVVSRNGYIALSTIRGSRSAAIKSWLGDGTLTWRLYRRRYGGRTAKVEIREAK